MILNGTAAEIAAVFLGYLIGAIPSSYIITKLATGKDIRTLGTGLTGVGNAGAHNVFSNVGRAAGVAVFIADFLKGGLAVVLAEWLLRWPSPSNSQPSAAIFFVLGAGVGAVIGHIWPVYLRFVGGGGLATTLGVLAVLMTSSFLIAMAMALVFFVSTRNAVFSVLIGLATLPAFSWLLGYRWWLIVFPLALFVVMLVHQAPNLALELRQAGSVQNWLARQLRRDRPKRKRDKK